MKALLLKDFYMIRRYCRMYLLLIIIFLSVSVVGRDSSSFFSIYPCLLVGMIPITLMAYDERSRWDRYCALLPVSAEQTVGEKYLLGVLLLLMGLLLSAAAGLIRQRLAGSVSVRSLLYEMSMIFSLALIAPSVSLPLLFRFGVEKGRIANYLMIAMICGGSIVASNWLTAPPSNRSLPGAVSVLICLAVYALSWYLSVMFYRRREL